MTLPEKADARILLPVNSVGIKKQVLILDINIIAHKFTHCSSMTLTVLVAVLDILTQSNDDTDHALGVTSMFH